MVIKVAGGQMSAGQHTQPRQQAELFEDTSDLVECSYCGELTAAVVYIHDDDPSVGYHDIVEMCPQCAPRRGR